MAVEELLRYDLLGSGILVGEVILTLIILVAGLLCVRWASKLLSRSLRSVAAPDLMEVFLVRLVRGLMYIAVIGVSLAPMGLDLTSLLVAYAVIGVIVGLALQEVLRNVLAGLLIAIYRPFKRGDDVSVAGQRGRVETVGVAALVLRTPDNHRVTIPNSVAWGGAIVDETAHEIRRLVVPVHLAYDQELPRALQVILDAASGHTKVLRAPRPTITVKELGPRAIVLALSVWCNTKDHAAVSGDLLVKVKERCDADGVVLYQGPPEVPPYSAGPRF